MNTKTESSNAQKLLVIKIALAAWESQQTRVSKLIDSLSDEDLLQETAPGRNRGTYLLGHLTAVSDAMLLLMGLGQKIHADLEPIFLTNPDKSGLATPAPHELRKYWNDVHSALLIHMKKMAPDDWFARHRAVSDEDFLKEPHRNKLNILLNRTTHMGYHFGQLAYLKKK